MQIDFFIKADEMGKGRVIVDGRFYGLPLAAVLEYKRLRDAEAVRNDTFEPVTTAGHAAGLVHNVEIRDAQNAASRHFGRPA